MASDYIHVPPEPGGSWLLVNTPAADDETTLLDLG